MLALIVIAILVLVIAICIIATRSKVGSFAGQFVGGFASKFASGNLDSLINSAPIVVFSKSGCPYCKKVKAALEDANMEYKSYELDQMENGTKITQELQKLTGMKTVPNVFARGKHIGDSNAAIKWINSKK